MSSMGQIAIVASMNLRNVPHRLGASAVIMLGMACVVAVIVSVASMSVGLMQMLHHSGQPDRVVVVGKGARGEADGSVSRDAARTVLDAPGIRTRDGKPVGSAEVVSAAVVPKRDTGLDVFVPVRGTGDLALRPEIRVTEGRLFQPGLRELIVGKLAQSQVGIAVGQEIRLNGTAWTVVGAFDTGGDIQEGSLLGGNETVLAALRRNAWSSVTLRLESLEAFDRLNAYLSANPGLSVEARREPQYLLDQHGDFNRFLLIVAYTVGAMMSLGAIFGALNTMYSAVRVRTVEIATLRAIGFGPAPVVVSVLLEAMLLSSGGAVIGALVAWLAFDGSRHTMGPGFASAVTLGLVLTGIGIALLIGLLGGILPAWRAARLPVSVALKAG